MFHHKQCKRDYSWTRKSRQRDCFVMQNPSSAIFMTSPGHDLPHARVRARFQRPASLGRARTLSLHRSHQSVVLRVRLMLGSSELAGVSKLCCDWINRPRVPWLVQATKLAEHEKVVCMRQRSSYAGRGPVYQRIVESWRKVA